MFVLAVVLERAPCCKQFKVWEREKAHTTIMIAMIFKGHDCQCNYDIFLSKFVIKMFITNKGKFIVQVKGLPHAGFVHFLSQKFKDI